ncbi:hypothetical protein LGL55_05745 [Clostridium tagluense]|uniref:exodeoxyribonuclease VII large subunit n=1 Tax=Clostridium tagluense TaxID=360422 RepID=UPI001CF466A8|nr:exodeoxyribonuclease VII large subunit [Clostridium tagluense]MCB2310625.1 hypothetical protein [Clostridium tagluense]MCB2315644.1 hypothetical protein [Clostridium tagluense]MCB2320498.1 hypothetical protein [Clostridium tagluense]MCB2325219.1 hypothetical protein [Clostridium tagluense]MCB2330071.1 hypothetical protein [Clostridium tagluense]
MEDNIYNDIEVYTPSSLINIFNDNLNVKIKNYIFKIEGLYIDQNLNQNQPQKEYYGCYYDRIKEKNSDQKITLVVPKKIKESLKNNFSYSFRGFLTKKINIEGYIQLNFKVIELISHEGKSNNDDFNEIKAIAVRNNKNLKDFKNFKLFVEDKLLKEQKPQFAIVIGNNAIIKDDIFNALGEQAGNYVIDEYRINLSSQEELIGILKKVDDGRYDSIIVTRGGGTGLEIFDKIEVLEAFSNTNAMLVTAIGHAVDFTYLQCIADYSFDTPTALGAFLKESSEKVNRIINDRNDEVSKLNNTMILMKEEYDNLNELSISEKSDISRSLELEKEEIKKDLTHKLEEKNKEIAKIKKNFIVTVSVLIVLFIMYKLIF